MRLVRLVVGMYAAMLSRLQLVRRDIDASRNRDAERSRCCIAQIGEYARVPKTLNLGAMLKITESEFVLLEKHRFLEPPSRAGLQPPKQGRGKRVGVEP